MLAEGRALGFEEEWMTRAMVEEFTLLVRRVVADRNIERQEHRKLDMARDLIGMSPDEAANLLQSVVAEAESFFGDSVRGA